MVNEIIHRLIDGEREDFQNGLQRLLNRVPRRGSTTEPEFSTYFFLGSVLTLPYTKLNGEIGVKASSVKITRDETVKLVFKIEKDGKTKLVFRTIAIGDKIDTAQELTVDEFKEALGSLDLTEDELNNCEVEGEIVHIESIKEKRRTKGKKRAVIDRKVSLEGLEVIGKGELNSETLKNLGPLPEYNEETAKFKKVKGGVIEKGSLDGALKEFSRGSLKVGLGERLFPSSKGAEALFENLSKVYRSEIVFDRGDKNRSKKLGLSAHEAAIHGFAYGALAMNFRYEYALRIRPEQAAGKGFVDLVVGSRGRELRVELKGLTNRAQDAKSQSEKNGYGKAPIIFSFGEKEKAKSVTMVFANLCLDPSSGGLLVEESKVPPKPERFIELFNEHSGESLKEKLKEKLNYLYYSISDSNGGGKNTNYLSRLILGELLADDTLKKRVFIYEGNHIEPGSAKHDTRSGQVPKDVSTEISKMVSTFLFKKQNGKYVILNVIEGENFEINKNIPLDGIELSKCTQVNIKVNPKADGGFEVENDIDKSYYQGIEIGGVTTSESEYYEGKFEKIDRVELKDITDITQVRGFQEALFPLRKLIMLENHFQAILQGLLSAQEGVEVLTEPNYSSRGRPDLMVSYDGKTGVVEVKLASTERDIERKKREGKTQLEARGDGLEVYTKEEKVAATVLVVCPNGTDKDKFITHSRLEDLNVEHSSRGSNSERILSPQSELGFQSPEWVPAEELDNQFRSPGSQSNSDRSPQRSVLSPIDQNSPSKRLSAEGLRRAAKCLPSPPKKPRLNKRAVIGDGCLLDMNEDKKVNKESTGIEVNEENFDESKIDNEKLRAYQEKIKDEGNEINDQLNKLIIEIQQAQAFKHFSDNRKLVERELFPALENIHGMKNENRGYFEQMYELYLLRIISPVIKDEHFKALLFNSPEKLIRNPYLLKNVFRDVGNLISEKYKKQQLQYENFEDLENQINEEIISKSAETRSIASQDVNKTDLLNYVFESIGLSLLMSQDTEVSIDLQKRIYYETLINLGSLIHDHKNHIRITHSGDQHAPHINSLVERVKSSKLLSIAHDLYYLRKNEGNIDQSNLCSGEVKSKISLYGSINSEYKSNDIYNKFNIDEIKSYFSEDELKKFDAEFEAYDKEVITIHSPQVFTSGNEVHVKVRDNNKQLIIGSIEDIKNIENYSYNEETLEIKLKVRNDKEYTITHEEEKREVKYYLNIKGYKTKIGNIINSFTDQAKNNIHHKLKQLQDKIELLTTKKDIEAMADIEEDYIREVRQNLLAQGVSESTFDQFKKQLDYVNEEVFGKYVSDISEELTKNNIEFNNSKFNAAKVKGAKGGKFLSIMAIYDLLDSVKDVPTLGRHDNDALKRIFGINGILDAMNDVRERLGASYIRPNGKVVTKIRPDSAIGKTFRKIPQSARKAFVKLINNPVVGSITFATVAYQFGYSIDAIVKGDHHPLNYYFATSNGIKLASMSMKPISMGASAGVKGLSATTKVLRVTSTVSKVLGKLSTITAVVDFAVTIGITIHEAVELVKAIGGKIPLSDVEQTEFFLDRILRKFSPLYLLIKAIENGKTLEESYKDAIKIKDFLGFALAEGKEILDYSSVVTTVRCLTSVKAGDYSVAAALQYLRRRDNDSLNAYLTSIKNPCDVAVVTQCLASKRSNDGLSTVVQYVTSIKDEYSEIIKSDRSPRAYNPECTTKSKYTGSSLGEINSNLGNLSSLDISKVLPLVSSTLGGREVYFVDKDIKYLPHVTSDEYNDGLRVVMMPSSFREGSLICGDLINEKIKSHSWPRKCNDGKVYRNCTKAFTSSGEPFIFTNIERSSSLPILYLSGPRRLVAARNYPAVMHVPKGEVNYKGSEYHDNTFIINYDTHGYIAGGTANNTIVMNYNTSDISVRLNTGIIYIADSRIRLVTNIFRHYIYNYISHSTANQNITTGCKTRYVDAGKGGGNNSIQNYDVNCQDEDYEIRKVNKKDTHLRSIKQTIFIVDKSSGSGANISSDNLKLKENLDVISVENADVAQLRINEHQNDYRLDFVACDEKDEVISVKVDSFAKLVIQVKKAGITKIIKIENKSLPDIIKDMAYQKLSHAGTDIDRKIVENSKKRSKAVIIADITGSENTTAYAVARGIAESSDNLGITVSQIQVIKGDIVLNYAVNDLNQIKLIPNNGISDEEQREYNRLLFQAVERKNLDEIRRLLVMGADVEVKRDNNLTPLSIAVRKNGGEVIDLLLDMGANINAKGVYNWTSAKWAVHDNRENLVIQLVNRGTDIGYKDNMGHTLLDTARRFGRERIANLLREKQSEYSRLFVDAVTRGDFYEVKDLLNRGADVNVRGDRIGTCLQLLAAIESNKFNKLQVLIDQCTSLDVGPMEIVIIKKLRDGMLCAPSTEFTNEVCNFHEELFGKMIKKVVSDVHGGADIKKILGFIRGCNNITRNIRGYVAVFDEIMKNNTNNEAMFTLASYVREVTEMNNYHNVSSEKRSELERIKRGLPKSVKNAVFSSEVCIKNAYQNEYLYAANNAFNYDSNRRRIFTWIPGERVGQGMWQIEVDDDSFYIRNVYHNEYLYASYDSFNYDNDRRRVFTWIPREKDEQSLWKIELLGNDTYIKNVKFNEYLYAASYAQYDVDRRRVFTFTRKEKVVQGVWQIEDCGTIRKRRDTPYHSERHQHLKDGKRSSRSPVYVRSIGIHGHHGITKEIEHDLFYDSVLNNSPQNDEAGYNKGKATSGTSKPSSWINVFANTIVGAIKGVSYFISSPFRAALPLSSENSSSRSDTAGKHSYNRFGTVRNPNIQYTNQFSREVCASNNASLMLFLLQVFLDKKCPLPKFSNVNPVEAIFYTSGIIRSFKEVLEKQAESKDGIKMHRLDINFYELSEKINKKIIGGEFNEISEILKSHVEKALPSRKTGDPGRLSRKKFDKFMAEFNSRIDSVIDQSMQQMLSRSEVSDVKEQRVSLEPKSYLNGISVQGHLTQDRNLKNEGRALIS